MLFRPGDERKHQSAERLPDSVVGSGIAIGLLRVDGQGGGSGVSGKFGERG